MSNTTTWRHRLVTVDGALLGGVGLVQALGDAASHFFGVGPLGVRLLGDFSAIGFFEAHGLALIIGMLMVTGRNDDSARWLITGAATHALLGGANLLFWQSFAHYGLA